MPIILAIPKESGSGFFILIVITAKNTVNPSIHEYSQP